MKGWIIYDANDIEENKAYIEWFIKEAAREMIQLKLIVRDSLDISIDQGRTLFHYEAKKIETPDFVVIRTIEPFLQHVFESLAIPTFNSFQVAFLTNHKSFTYIEMQKLGIPVLSSYFTTKDHFPSEPPFAYPFVVKEATGRGGKQVHFIQSDDMYQEVKRDLQAKDIIIQDASVQLGKDVRVFVIGKEIIAAILRKNDRDFRANYRLGGEAEIYKLNAEEKAIVHKILSHFDFGLVGIDFLLSEDGSFIFNEIEDVVGSRTLSAKTNINLLQHYVSFIKKTVMEKSWTKIF